MFRSRAAAARRRACATAQQVEARALVDALRAARPLPAQRSRRCARPALGPLYERFLRLKEKLEREGLFDRAREARAARATRARSACVTSLAAAALRDVLTTLARRNPAIARDRLPGAGAGRRRGRGASPRCSRARARAPSATCCSSCAAAARSRTCGSSTRRRVARAIRASRIPVVVGVGHETDFTIADFAADRRAPTPTAAAELATPVARRARRRGSPTARAASRARCAGGSQYAAQALDGCARRLVHPARAAARASASWSRSSHARLALRARATACTRCEAKLARLQAALAGPRPAGGARARLQHHLRRRRRGAARRGRRCATGERLLTTLARGAVESEVKKREPIIAAWAHRLSKITTRTGDAGETGLGDGSRVSKDSARVARAGRHRRAEQRHRRAARGRAARRSERECSEQVQHDLFDLGGEVSIPGHACSSERR